MTARALVLPASDARGEIKRWALAAAIVCSAHFALIAGYVLMPAAEPESAAETPAVLVDLTPVAPASRNDFAVPGPEMLEALPTQKPTEQIEPQVVEPIPRLEAPAEVTLPLPEPEAVEKKSEQDPNKQKSETTPDQDNTPLPQINSGARSEQNTALTARAPIASWLATVSAKIKAAQRVKARNERGSVVVKFQLSRDGSVLSRRIVRGSGHAELDQEALAMIVRAAPLPPFPPGKTEETAELELQINFLVDR